MAEHERRSDQYFAKLPKTVLKGHLIVEEMLFAIAASHCAVPVELTKAKLTFAQLLHITQALVTLPIGKRLWPAIAQLNALRNSLIHNLEPKEIDKKILAISQFYHADKEQFPAGYVPPTEPAQIAGIFISYIIGALSIMGPAAEFIERNRQLPMDRAQHLVQNAREAVQKRSTP